MATGGAPFDGSSEELQNWTVTKGSLEDRLNNMVSTHHYVFNDKYLFVLFSIITIVYFQEAK